MFLTNLFCLILKHIIYLLCTISWYVFFLIPFFSILFYVFIMVFSKQHIPGFFRSSLRQFKGKWWLLSVTFTMIIDLLWFFSILFIMLSYFLKSFPASYSFDQVAPFLPFLSLLVKELCMKFLCFWQLLLNFNKGTFYLTNFKVNQYFSSPKKYKDPSLLNIW